MIDVLTRYEPLLGIQFRRPADEFDLMRLDYMLHTKAPAALRQLLQITNGMELHHTQTTFYSVKEICQNRIADLPKGLVAIGVYNFGDPICMQQDGTIVQLSADDNLPYLSWGTLNDFLYDEYQGYKGGAWK